MNAKLYVLPVIYYLVLTVIGKWQDPSGGGTKEIIESGLSKSGKNKGGMNVLNEDVPRSWPDDRVWAQVNEPWLREATERGDIIRAVSDPLNIRNVFSNIDNIPNSAFSSPDDLFDFLKNLNDPNRLQQLSFYGRELRYLAQNDYFFDVTNKTFAR